MNSNVPRGAAILLDFIAKLETNRQGQAAYETIIGYRNEKPGTLPKPITEMTLEELLAEQRRWVKNLRAPSGAAGRYQIIRPTLFSLIAANTLSLRDFGNQLAREWASFPVLSRQQGGYRTVERGESYYAGDGINASLAKASEAEAVLAEVLNELGRSPAAPIPLPRPQPAPPLNPYDDDPSSSPPPKRGIAGWLILAGVVAAALGWAAFNIPLPL